MIVEVNLSFIQPASFVQEWRRLKLTDEDLQTLESLIRERPERGVVVRGTDGLRKLRFAPPSWHTGKSGALRICYLWLEEFGIVYLLILYSKLEKADLSPAEQKYFKAWVEALRRYWEEEQS